MLADQLDYVIGVARTETRTRSPSCTSSAARSCSRRRSPQTATATVEGTGSFGSGLTRFLSACGERVLEVGRLRRERRSGGKTDALDAVRAARRCAHERAARDTSGRR
jgi:hypothetical protein